MLKVGERFGSQKDAQNFTDYLKIQKISSGRGTAPFPDPNPRHPLPTSIWPQLCEGLEDMFTGYSNDG